MARVVQDAGKVIAATGLRSRDRDLLHYPDLYGRLRHGELKNHLLRLVDLHKPAGRVNIGTFWDLHIDGERFICASERTAVVVLPSVTSLLDLDTALVIDDPTLAGAYVAHWLVGHQQGRRCGVSGSVEHSRPPGSILRCRGADVVWLSPEPQLSDLRRGLLWSVRGGRSAIGGWLPSDAGRLDRRRKWCVAPWTPP